MAAPSPTVRQSPNGKALENGKATKITFARFPDVAFWEHDVTPPGFDGGEPIITSTMHSVEFDTKSPRSLTNITNAACMARWDPKTIDEVRQMINIPDTVTYRLPDGSTVAHYAYLKSGIPQSMAEGATPMIALDIVHTAWDHVNNVEAGPFVTLVAGT
jgi:hypothetical protein